MKKTLLLIILLYLGVNTSAQISNNCFLNPPDSTKVLTWWHWINGHVSKSGIKNDLEMIKKVGLGGVILFNIGFFPEGPVSFNSDIWWNMVKYSIQKSDSLGLKFGVFNSDGWSMSGGPWISVKESMKEITYSDTIIHGGRLFNSYLPKPSYLDSCYHIATIAYPFSTAEIPVKPICAQSGYYVNKPEFMIDSSESTQTIFKYSGDSISFILFDFNKIQQIQSLTLFNISAVNFLDASAYITYSTDGKNYKRVTELLPINLKSEGINKGLTLTFPKIEARFVKLFVEFERTATKVPIKFNQTEIRVGDIHFFATPKIMLWESKSGATKRIRHDRQLLNNREMNDWEDSTLTNASTFIQKDRIINLSDKIGKDGRLLWNVPPGDWKVLQIAYTSTMRKNAPASKYGSGYECNKMDSNAVINHFNSYVARVNALSQQTVGKPIDYMQMESWEAGIQNWSTNFDQKFEEITGYSIIPWLPVLTEGWVVNSIDESNRFLWDYRNVIAELIRKNYWEVMYNLAHKNGIKVLGEGSGMQHYLYDPIKYMQHTDIPMGELWKNEEIVRTDCKNAATVAHIKGKSIVAAEAFTANGPEIWKYTPKDFKLLGDNAFTTGVNQFVLHSYVHQPYEFAPGITLSNWGDCFQRLNTWFPYSSGWLCYLQRCQNILQQGSLVTDVCYFTGEGIPGYLGLRHELKPSFPSGYDYDGIDPKTLLQLVVHEGKLVLPGIASWSLLVVRDYKKITHEVLNIILKLVENGAIVMMGKPEKSPSLIGYPDCDQLINELTEKIWKRLSTASDSSVINYGKGKIMFNCSIQNVLLNQNIIPDFTYEVVEKASDCRLNYIHKKLIDKDIYFVNNNVCKRVHTILKFRQQNKKPIIVDPYNGKVYAIPFSEKDNCTELRLEFEECGSYIILFGNKQAEKLIHYTIEKKLPISTPWNIRFDNGYVKIDTIFDRLQDWIKSDNEDIKYYSGMATYDNYIELQPKRGRTYVLDLDTVCNVAEVYLNGHFVSNLWKAPYQTDITKYILYGKNKIEIKVVNTMVNRMIGDERYPEDIHYQESGDIADIPQWIIGNRINRKSKRETFVTFKYRYSDADLQHSGIMGNTRILIQKQDK